LADRGPHTSVEEDGVWRRKPSRPQMGHGKQTHEDVGQRFVCGVGPRDIPNRQTSRRINRFECHPNHAPNRTRIHSAQDSHERVADHLPFRFWACPQNTPLAARSAYTLTGSGKARVSLLSGNGPFCTSEVDKRSSLTGFPLSFSFLSR
jgi:hypothetical protein